MKLPSPNSEVVHVLALPLSLSLSCTHSHTDLQFSFHKLLTRQFTVQINSGLSSGPVRRKEQQAEVIQFLSGLLFCRLLMCFKEGNGGVSAGEQQASDGEGPEIQSKTF